ncbi:hypothetical protein AAFF_G00364030 [Aldrovandia affinis]|uniref:Retropepsins domain-containing protein n=1 Tax=Aldrovandia affinis TaxID=143900 RepID=A0AAD7WMP9_9TELE|nr:hypothetical protein AAFF_G00364030 [Aldrovandia affinis]
MPTAESASSPQVHFAALLGESRDRRPTCPVTVNQRDVEALLDSGSAITLVQESVLEAPSFVRGDPVPVVCVHGDTREYPTTMVKLRTTKGSFDVEPKPLQGSLVALNRHQGNRATLTNNLGQVKMTLLALEKGHHLQVSTVQLSYRTPPWVMH